MPAGGSSPNGEEFCDLIYAELLLRRELGEQPPLSEYLYRFPQFREQLSLVAELDEHIDSGLTAEAQVSTLADTAQPCTCGRALRAGPWCRATRFLESWVEAAWGSSTKPGRLTCNGFVALKMIRAGHDADAAALARFRVEAEAVAQLAAPEHRANLRNRRPGWQSRQLPLHGPRTGARR